MVKRTGLKVEQFKDDAQDFKPSRWLESDGQSLKNNPKGFMPFGGVSTALKICHHIICHHNLPFVIRLLFTAVLGMPTSAHSWWSVPSKSSHFSATSLDMQQLHGHGRRTAYGPVKSATLNAGAKDLPGDAAGKDGDARTAGTSVTRVSSAAGGP